MVHVCVLHYASGVMLLEGAAWCNGGFKIIEGAAFCNR